MTNCTADRIPRTRECRGTRNSDTADTGHRNRRSLQIAQRDLDEYYQLAAEVSVLKEMLNRKRSELLGRLDDRARVEPGILSATVKNTYSQIFSAEKLRDTYGKNEFDEMCERVPKTLVRKLIVKERADYEENDVNNQYH